MVVAFWSPYHGQTGTTTTALAIASMVAMTNNYKVLLGHSQFERSTLERCLMHQSHSTEEDLLSFNDHGLDALRRLAKNGRLLPEMVSNYTTPLLAGNRLDLLQGIAGFNGDEAAEEIKLLHKIFISAKSAYDLVLIDVHSGMKQSLTQKLLEDADMVVVCLNQNHWLLEDFFEDHSAQLMLKDKKIIYHLSAYDSRSRFTAKNIQKLFSLDEVIVTPYSSALMDACNTGTALDFFMRHIACTKKDRYYPLMSVMTASVEKFLSVLSTVATEEMSL